MKKFQKGLPAGRQGFTLAEILIVISIIVLLSLFGLMNIRGQMAHATDIRRKTDLYTLSKSFEDYYNDNSEFPGEATVDDCGGTMTPYITNIPCDPVSGEPYGYFLSVSGGYRVCAVLTDTTDPAIAAAGCGGSAACGLGGPPSGRVYNYCVASGVTASAVGTEDEIPVGDGDGGELPTPTPTPDGDGGGGTPVPTPTLTPDYHYACTPSPDGDCNKYADPGAAGCPIAWEFACPAGECDNPANRCAY